MKYGFIIKRNGMFFTNIYDSLWSDSIDSAYFFTWPDSSTPKVGDLVSSDICSFSGAEVVRVARKIIEVKKDKSLIHDETFREIQREFYQNGKNKNFLNIEHHIIFNIIKGKSIYSGVAVSYRKDTLHKINRAIKNIQSGSCYDYKLVFGNHLDYYVYSIVKNRLEKELDERYEDC